MENIDKKIFNNYQLVLVNLQNKTKQIVSLTQLMNQQHMNDYRITTTNIQGYSYWILKNKQMEIKSEQQDQLLN